MYFVYLYENRAVKPVKIVLIRKEKGVKENDGEGEPN
jgi:hypothetical protein